MPKIRQGLRNIYPIFDKVLKREQKQNLLKQKSIVIWLVGLSGSGKSTLARSAENNLHQLGYTTQLLDGDNLRVGINNNLGFSEEDRVENIRRAAEVSKLFMECGVITLCSFISPTEDIRKMASQIIGERYFEVFVNCPLEVCEQRDVKGLYAKARQGEIPEFTGVSAPFEEPRNPHLELRTDLETIEDSQARLISAIIDRVKHES